MRLVVLGDPQATGLCHRGCGRSAGIERGVRRRRPMLRADGVDYMAPQITDEEFHCRPRCPRAGAALEHGYGRNSTHVACRTSITTSITISHHTPSHSHSSVRTSLFTSTHHHLPPTQRTSPRTREGNGRVIIVEKAPPRAHREPTAQPDQPSHPGQPPKPHRVNQDPSSCIP